MKNLLLTTAMLAAMSAGAFAQTVPDSLTLGGTVKTSSGLSFSNVGMSSEGEIGTNGLGGGAVVISNSGLDITLNPVAFGLSTVDLETGALTGGVIDVTNTRSVDVTGSMIGKGQVAGSGTTATTFDASLLSSAKATNTLAIPVGGDDNSLDQTYSVSGLANLSGASSSTAGFSLIGSTTDFIGETGTEVGGSFDATAGYLQVAVLDQYFDTGFALGGLFDTEFGTYSSIKVSPTDIDLAVENLGGGTVLLTGASSDLFSGAVLGSADSAVTLFGTDVDLIGGALCSVDSVLCDLNVNP